MIDCSNVEAVTVAPSLMIESLTTLSITVAPDATVVYGPMTERSTIAF